MAELLDVLTRVETVAAVNDDDIINIIRNGELYKVGADVFKGAPGIDGTNGANGIDGTNGVGVPTGGTEGQVLSKKTSSDYDTKWIDPPASNGGVVDLTSAIEDYELAIGETAIINYTSATSVPLHVVTGGGIFELCLVRTGPTTATSDDSIFLQPNNVPVAVTDMSFWSGGSWKGTLNNGFAVSAALLYIAKIVINTGTAAKSTHSTSTYKVVSGTLGSSVEMCIWDDSTTPWASLGTITFPFVQSGKIVIRRII